MAILPLPGVEVQVEVAQGFAGLSIVDSELKWNKFYTLKYKFYICLTIVIDKFYTCYKLNSELDKIRKNV